MATAQADALRRDLQTLIDLAQNDLILAIGDLRDPNQVRDLLLDLLPRLAEMYGSAAATLAADWYDDLRAEIGVKKRFTAIPAELPDRGRTDALARWGVSPLFQATPDLDAARTLLSGGLQRIVANASRDTVRFSSIADPSARGWQRVGIGADCTFCAMLIGRGAVYTEARADFASHDHCNCAAVPAFGGEPQPVQSYTPSLRNSSDADRARVRAYLRTN